MPVLPGSYWRPSGATRNSWGWWLCTSWDSEGQGHPATTGAPGPVWVLGAHLWRQPRAASLRERRALGTGAGGLLPPPRALHPICCQCKEVLEHPAGTTKERQRFPEIPESD